MASPVARVENFLSSLFKSFEDAGIKFCILRNYQTLPYELKSGDVDLLVLERQKKEAEKILHQNNSLFDCYFRKVSRLQYVYSFWISEKASVYKNSDLLLNIKIDFFFNEEWFGSKVVTGEEILQNRVRYRNFFVPDSTLGSIILLLDCIIYKKYFKNKYKDIVLRNFRAHSRDISRKLILILGEKIGKEIVSSLEQNDLDRMLIYEKQIKLQILKNGLLKYNICFLIRALKFLSYELRVRIKKGKILFSR